MTQIQMIYQIRAVADSVLAPLAGGPVTPEALGQINSGIQALLATYDHNGFSYPSNFKDITAKVNPVNPAAVLLSSS